MKKEKKSKAILFAILFILIYFGIQLLVGAVGGIIAAVTSGATDPAALQAIMAEIMPTITFITEIVLIVAFGLWYYLSSVKKDKANGTYESGFKKVADVKPLIFIVLLTFATYFLVLFISTTVNALVPAFGESFGNMMNLAMGTDILGYLSVMLLAPIAEEFAFRGVLLKNSKRSFGFIGCLVLNAIVFSIIHANPLQSIYVIPMGVMLAYLAYRYNSVVPSMIAHIINNSFSVIMSKFFNVDLSVVANIILLVVFCALTVLFTKATASKTESIEC